MNIWTKGLLVLLSVGGGFHGLILTAMGLSQAGGKVGNILAIVVMAFAYVLGIAAGFKFIQNSESGLNWLRIYFALQVPIVSSPVFSYFLSSGAAINCGWIQDRLFLFGKVGSDFEFTLFMGRPWGIGVNLLGLVLFLWVHRLCEQIKVPEDESNTAQSGGWTW